MDEGTVNDLDTTTGPPDQPGAGSTPGPEKKGAGKLSNPDPRHHTAKVRGMLSELIDHLREDVGKFSDPKAKALFETGAEVLIGLRTAFEHYEKGTEPPVWEPA